MPYKVPDFSDDECRKFVGKLGRVFESQVLLDIARSDNAMSSLLSRTGRTPLAIKWVAKRCVRGDLLENILATQGALFDYCVGAEFRELSAIARQVVELLHESEDWMSTSDLVSLIEQPYESLQIAMRELNDRMFLDQRSGDGITTQFRLNETVNNFLRYSAEVDVLRGVQNRRRIRALRQHGSQNEIARQQRGYFSPYFVDVSDPSQHAVTARLYECLGAGQRQNPTKFGSQLRLVKSLQESAPKYWEVFRVGAHLLHWSGRWADAADDMRRAVELAPTGRPKARCLHFLAQILSEHDDQESLEIARRAFQESPEWSTQLELGRRSYFAGRIGDAIAILEEMYKDSSEEGTRYIAAAELAKAYQRGSQMNVDTTEDRVTASQFARSGLINLLQCYELRFLTREFSAEQRGLGTNNSSRMVDIHLEMFSRYVNELSLAQYVQERQFLDRVVEALSDLGARGILDVVSAKQLVHSKKVVENVTKSIGPKDLSDIFRNFVLGRSPAESKVDLP
jgi:tetratricopeptide (TPR) repeat protein